MQTCAACQDLPTLHFLSKFHHPFWSYFPFFINIFNILILFVLYFKNYKRQMLSLSCKHVHNVKIYLPCSFQVNPITHFGVITLFSSNFLIFNSVRPLFQNLLEINCKNIQHVKIYKKIPTVENVWQLCEELFLLKCIFCWLTAFGYSNNQREATLLQNVK